MHGIDRKTITLIIFIVITGIEIKCVGLLNVDTSIVPTTVNADSQYSFILYANARILNTDQIVITFPSQVILANGLRNCQASCAGDATLSIHSCISNSNILTATIQSTLATTTDYVVKLQVLNGITNPPCAVADSFSAYIYTSSNAVKDSNDSFNIFYSAATLQNSKISSSSNVSGAIADLTIIFTPGQPILAGGSIKITLPNYNQSSGSSVSIFLISVSPPTSVIVNSGLNLSAISLINSNSITLVNIFPYTNSDTITQISFTIKNILNPPSTAPFAGYKITTSGSASIEVSPILALQATLPSTFSSFTLSSTNTIVNQMTTLKFAFISTQFIPAGAILELIFPNEVPISQLTLTSIIGISKMQSSVSYTINGQAILITNAIPIYYLNTDVHYFQVSSIQNPSSVTPTSSFKFNIYTPDNYIMYSLNFFVNLTATPGQFSNIIITQLNQEINSITTYKFSFSNNDVIMAGSNLQIIFPTELKIDNLIMTICNKILSGISINAYCEIVSNSILNITNGFPANLISNSLLSFSIDNVHNYFCVKQTSSFTIGSYTNANYLIDFSNNGIFVNFNSGILINTSITSTSKINADSSSYQFSFQLKNDFQIKSNIIINFPIEVLIIDIINLQTNCNIKITTNGNNTLNLTNVCLVSFDTNNLPIVTISNINPSSIIPALSIIYITLPTIQNPRSLKPSSNFSITTITNDGYIIDKSIGPLTITNTLSAITTSLIIIPTSFINGDSSTYKFDIIPAIKLISGDILVITFPSQINGLLGNTSLSIIGTLNLGQNIKNSILINSQGIPILYITIILTNSCNCTNIGDKLSFQVQNLKNPVSLKPTDNFIISVTTFDAFLIEGNSNQNGSQITMLYPNIINNAYVKPLNIQINIISDYSFQFSTFNIMPLNALILVNYPSQISVVDGTCIPISNLPSNISCFNNSNSRTITLSGAFTSLSSSASSIQFNIKNLQNIMPSGLTVTDTFEIFTQTYDGYLIDQKITGLNIIFTCQTPCATCLSDQITCLSCNQSSTTPLLLTGKCINKCPTGYAPNSDGSLCIQCNPVCSTCSSDNKDKCLSCSSSFPFFMVSSLTCVLQCPIGHYVDPSTNNCLKCISPCNTCTSQTNCTSCLNSSLTNLFYLYYPTTNKCLASCPSGITILSIDANTCLDCDSSCLTCSNSTSNCTSCKNTTLLYNGKCISNQLCPVGYYADIQNNQCSQCNTNCKICGKSFNDCQQCNSGYILYNNSCVTPQSTCPIGYFLDITTSLCTSCSAPCFGCITNPLICTSCPNGLFLLNSNCVNNCGDGHFITIDVLTGQTVCQSCNSSCKSCTDENAMNCQSCYIGFFLYNNICVQNCPIGFYGNSYGVCQKCIFAFCDKCNDNKCLKCSIGYFELNGICLNECPIGYTKDIINSNCAKDDKAILYYQYVQKFKYPQTYFVFFLSLILIIIINTIVKYICPETYFLASFISMASIVNICHNYYFIYQVFLYGNKTYFLMFASITILTITLNNIFIIAYEFFTNSDNEFAYWKSSRNLISFLFFIFSFIFDYKLIRFFYSRFLMLDWFSAKLKNFNRVHHPYRILVIVEILLVCIPMIIYSIYILAKSKYFSILFYSAFENLLITCLCVFFKLIDLNKNEKLNEDFYNQKKGYPDIMPYEYVFDNLGQYNIIKRFDYSTNEADNTNQALKSSKLNNSMISNNTQVLFNMSKVNLIDSVNLDQKNNPKNEPISRCLSWENLDTSNIKFCNEDSKFENKTVVPYRDDTYIQTRNINLSPAKIHEIIKEKRSFRRKNYSVKFNKNSKYFSPTKNMPTIVERMSEGLKDIIHSFSPKKKKTPYQNLEELENNIEIQQFDISTPNFNSSDIDKTDRSNIPFNY